MAALGLGLACNPFEPPLCDICTTSAIVYGAVRDTAGQPVAGAVVTVHAMRDSCAGLAAGGSNVAPVTNAAGGYRDAPFSPSGPFHACLAVNAHAPTGALWHDTTLSGAVVKMA